MKRMMKLPTDEQLLSIARTHLKSSLTTLESRNSDSLDFFEVSVWSIREALQAACELGWNMAKEE